MYIKIQHGDDCNAFIDKLGTWTYQLKLVLSGASVEIFHYLDAAREDLCAGQYATQITVTEYEQQKKEFTQASVEQLLNSDEYQRKWLSCGTYVFREHTIYTCTLCLIFF